MAEFHRLKSLKDQEPAEWAALNRQAEALTKTVRTAELPSLQHLKMADYAAVYEPAEDTYLLVDAMQYALDQGAFDDADDDNNNNNKACTLLEIGCGTGVPTVWFRHAWQRRYPHRTLHTYVTDINPKAIEVALATDQINNPQLAPIHAVRCDLATALVQDLAGAVDVLIFNPPYVPTPDDEVVDFEADRTLIDTITGDEIIAAAWAGGANGRRVVDRALAQVQGLLRGTAFLVTVDDNQPAALSQLCAQKYQLSMTPLLRRRTRNEYLTIQRLQPLAQS
jgi:release factor glutamine methyltransferase